MQDNELVLSSDVREVEGQLLAEHQIFTLRGNPALQYITSLQSHLSKKVMTSLLDVVARYLGYSGIRDCDWVSISNYHVMAFVSDSINAGKAPSTINTYLAAIRGVARAAWRSKMISRDQLDRILDVSAVRGTRLAKGGALDADEIKALIQICLSDTSPRGIRDCALFSLSIGCGLRRSELIALTRGDVDLKYEVIRVLGKGNKEREAYMPPAVTNFLQTWMEYQSNYWLSKIGVAAEDSMPLFPRIKRHDVVTNEFITSQAVWYLLKERLKIGGMEDRSPHDLRRTFATILLDQGEDIFTVQQAMGHSNVATTQKYDRRGVKNVMSAAKKFNLGGL